MCDSRIPTLGHTSLNAFIVVVDNGIEFRSKESGHGVRTAQLASRYGGPLIVFRSRRQVDEIFA